MHLKPQGRHRPKRETYTLPLVESWEAMRSQYAKPSRWARLTKWMRTITRVEH